MASRKHPFSFPVSRSCNNCISALEGSLFVSWSYQQWFFSQATLWNVADRTVCDSGSQKKKCVFPAVITFLGTARHYRSVVRTWSQETQCLLSTVFSSCLCFPISLFSVSTVDQLFDISIHTFRHAFLKPQNVIVLIDWKYLYCIDVSMLNMQLNILKNLIHPPSYSRC